MIYRVIHVILTMINKVIIFGVSGMLGRYINGYLNKNNKYTIISIERNEFDVLLNLSKLEDLLLSKQIDDKTCIINCIGLIPQRFKNSVRETDYFIINSIFPQLLSKYCNKYESKLIHPTTDCVYNGVKGNYIETDYHDETGIYGISKSLGENIECMIIRTSIIGEEVNNKYSFLEWVKNSKGDINGYANHLWNGITCLQYSKIIEKIIDNNLFWKGIRHIYSPEAKSKYELCCIIKDTYHLQIEINKMETMPVVNKTLSSIHELLFIIPTLETQIKELCEYSI